MRAIGFSMYATARRESSADRERSTSEMDRSLRIAGTLIQNLKGSPVAVALRYASVTIA